MYARTTTNFCKFMQTRSILGATHFDVREYIALVARKGASQRTLRNELYSLRILFDFLNLGGLVNWVPPRLVHLPRPEPYIPTVLTEK